MIDALADRPHWLVSGFLLGLLVIGLLWAVNRRLGVSGGFAEIGDRLAGRTQVLMTSPGATLRQLADAGKLKIIATSGAKRLDQLSHLPTISEQGVPGYEAYSWWGLVAPSGTPPGVVERLNTALNAALDLPEIRERLRAEGVPEERFATTPEAFGAWIAAEYALWGKVIRERNIRFE